MDGTEDPLLSKVEGAGREGMGPEGGAKRGAGQVSVLVDAVLRLERSVASHTVEAGLVLQEELTLEGSKALGYVAGGGATLGFLGRPHRGVVFGLQHLRTTVWDPKKTILQFWLCRRLEATGGDVDALQPLAPLHQPAALRSALAMALIGGQLFFARGSACPWLQLDPSPL